MKPMAEDVVVKDIFLWIYQRAREDERNEEVALNMQERLSQARQALWEAVMKEMPDSKQENFADSHGAFTDQFNRGYNQVLADITERLRKVIEGEK